jgi:hypothetical protein
MTNGAVFCFVDGVEGLLYAVMQFGDIFVMGEGDVIARGIELKLELEGEG